MLFPGAPVLTSQWPGDSDARTRAEAKVAIILEENEETLALLALMLKRRGMDQATAELTLRKAGWWRG